MNSMSSVSRHSALYPNKPTVPCTTSTKHCKPKPVSLCSRLTAVAILALLATRAVGSTVNMNNSTAALIPSNTTGLNNFTGAEIQTTAVRNEVVLNTAQDVENYVSTLSTSGVFVTVGTVEDAQKLIDGDSTPFNGAELLRVDNISNKDFNKLRDSQAEKGTPADWYERGSEYQLGVAGVKDMPNAMKWYEKAAKEKNTEAMTMLGVLYYEGKDGVQKNEGRAREYIIEAANLGDPNAQYQQGFLYNKGSCGFKKDFTKAMESFKKAAVQDHVLSQSVLGDAYQQGTMVKQDLKEAARWYFKAAENGDAHAQYQLGDMHMNGEGGCEKSYKKAVVWLEKAANQEHRLAQATLGILYQVEDSKDLAQDLSKAIYWHEKAANNGIHHSLLPLAAMYHSKFLDEIENPNSNLDDLNGFIDKAIEFVKQAAAHEKIDANDKKKAKAMLEELYNIKRILGK